VLSLPLLDLLERRLPRVLAITLTVLLNLLVIAGIVALITMSLSSFVDALPRYRDQGMALLDQVVSGGESAGMPAARWGEEGLFDAASVIDLVGGTLKGVATLATMMLLVLTIMAFILIEVDGFPEKLDVAFGADVRRRWRYARIRYDVQRYLAMKSVVSLV